jgi:TonB family protein
MPTRAFLLSHDEKALDAVTQILSELEVSFELFHEPSFAVKRVASHHFDMILMDCDNEQNATQVFTSAKNSGVNQSTISIAIVDGKNGVANAFRLGASLVLSKPVSIEQARGTVRNALAMVRKASPESKNTATATHTSAPIATKTDLPGVPEASSHSTLPLAKPSTPAPAPMKAIAEVPPASVTAPAKAASKSIETPLKPLSPNPMPTSTDTLPLSKEGVPKSKPSKASNLSLMGADLPPIGSSRQPAPPTFGMAEKKEKAQRRTSPALLAVVTVALAAASTYSYSMFNPSFHRLLVSQYSNALSLAGLAPKVQVVAAVPKPAPHVPATPPAPAATPAATAANPGTAAADNNQQPDGFAPPPSDASSQGSSDARQKSATPVILSTSATTVEKPATDNEPLVVPEEVADGHVAYRVQPSYPEAARHKGVKGSVVLTADVDKDGNVAAVHMLSGNAQLAKAAITAVKQWRYETYYHGGQPAEFQTQVTVRFPQHAQR